MKPLSSWRLFTQLGPFRWSALAPWRAGRVALGVALPILVAWYSGHVDIGVYMALGALPAGFVSFQGQARSRIAGIALASIGMALSNFVGATMAADAPHLLLLIVALWAYLTGLSVCLGPIPSIATLQWSLAVMIGVGLPHGHREAAGHAALVCAGGFLQAAIVAASWVNRTGAKERNALAASYRELMAYALELAKGSSAAPPPAAFPAQSALADPNPLLAQHERLLYLDLLEQAERIRATLAALASTSATGDRDEFDAMLSEAGGVLESIADALSTTSAQRLALARGIEARLERLHVRPDAPWHWSAETLLGQLRAVAHMIARPAMSDVSPPWRQTEDVSARQRAATRIATGIAMLRANLTLRSEAGRHAIRLAAIATFSELLTQTTGLYQGRWVTLTIFIVLKPDYTSTLVRGAHRALGTIIGALIGAALIQLGHPQQGWLILAVLVSVFLAYALFEVNFLLFSVPLTVFVMLLLALLGMPAMLNAKARIVDTIVGAALAMLAYIAWPTQRAALEHQTFAALIDAHRAYAVALLEALVPGKLQATRLRMLQDAARRVRSDADAVAARLASASARPPLTPDLAQQVIATIARLAQVELALHAFVLANAHDVPHAEAFAHLENFKALLDTAMRRMTDALQRLSAPKEMPSLRAGYLELISRSGPLPTPLVDILDKLVDASNTLNDVLKSRL